jgi:hypothetical protein
MKTICALLLLVLSPLALAAPARSGETDVSLTWSPGWDNLTRPLDYHHSYVHFAQSETAGQLTITYVLSGAVPKAPHVAGIHLFWGRAGVPDLRMCLHHFGQFGATGCAYTCRQGTCRTYNSFELCQFTTDAHGNGACTVTVSSIARGRYELEIDVRHSPDPVSAVIFQTPGPYAAGTLSFTMPLANYRLYAVSSPDWSEQ